MKNEVLEELRPWAERLLQEDAVEQIAVFGSLIAKDGINFGDTSDIDLLIVLAGGPGIAEDRLRQLGAIKKAVGDIEPALLRSLGRSLADVAIVSVLAVVRCEIRWGVHKENQGFYQNNRFFDLATGKECSLNATDDLSLDLELSDMVSVLRAVQKFRNQYLKISANGKEQVGGVVEGVIPKGIKRHAALLAWHEADKRFRVDDEHYDLAAGYAYVMKLLSERRDLGRYRSLTGLVHRRTEDQKSNPLSAEDLLLLWETLFDNAVAQVRSREGKPIEGQGEHSSLDREFMKAYAQDEEVALRLRVRRKAVNQKFRRIGFDPVEALAEASRISRVEVIDGVGLKRFVQLVEWALVGISCIEEFDSEMIEFSRRKGIGGHVSQVITHSKFFIQSRKELLEVDADVGFGEYHVENLRRALEIIVKFVQPEPDWLDPRGLGYLSCGMGATLDDSCDVVVGVEGLDEDKNGVILLLNEEGKLVSRLFARFGSRFDSLDIRGKGISESVTVSAIQKGIRYLWCASGSTPVSSFVPPKDWGDVRVWHRSIRGPDVGVCVDGRGRGFLVQKDDMLCPVWVDEVASGNLAVLHLTRGGDVYRGYVCDRNDGLPLVSLFRNQAFLGELEIPWPPDAERLAGLRMADQARLSPEGEILEVDGGMVLVLSGVVGVPGSSYIFFLDIESMEFRTILRVGLVIETFTAVVIGKRIAVSATIMRDPGVQFMFWNVTEDGLEREQSWSIQGRKTWELCGRACGEIAKFWFTAECDGVSEVWSWSEGDEQPRKLHNSRVCGSEGVVMRRIACLP